MCVNHIDCLIKELGIDTWQPYIYPDDTHEIRNPNKQRYVVRSAKCSTKYISKLLTFILSKVKTGLQSYYDTSYSRGGVNQMWILENSKAM